MKIIQADNNREYEFFEEMKSRAGEISLAVNSSVMQMINEVREKGDEAVRRYGIQFDGAAPQRFAVDREEIRKAWNNADESLKKALIHAKENIAAYHEKQVQQGYEIAKENGIVLGQIVRGLSRVGIYVPGGTAAYPSTVLMNAIPAKIAGVEEIIMVTPPLVEMKNGSAQGCIANPDILAAAYLAGVDKVLLAGEHRPLRHSPMERRAFPGG